MGCESFWEVYGILLLKQKYQVCPGSPGLHLASNPIAFGWDWKKHPIPGVILWDTNPNNALVRCIQGNSLKFTIHLHQVWFLPKMGPIYWSLYSIGRGGRLLRVWMVTYWAFVHGIFMSISGYMKNNLQTCPGDKLWLLYDINLVNTPFERGNLSKLREIMYTFSIAWSSKDG